MKRPPGTADADIDVSATPTDDVGPIRIGVSARRLGEDVQFDGVYKRGRALSTSTAVTARSREAWRRLTVLARHAKAASASFSASYR